MVFKLLIVFAALFGFVAFAEAQNPPWDRDAVGNDEVPIHERCSNESICNASCEGAAPPPSCPANIPECPSGCACSKDCSTNTLTCFMTKHCSNISRLLTERRRPRAVNQDDLSEAQGDSQLIEQDLTASEAQAMRTEQNLPASSAAQDTEISDPAATGTQASGRRVERELSSSTIYMPLIRSGGNETHVVKLVDEKKKIEKAAEAAAEAAAEKAVMALYPKGGAGRLELTLLQSLWFPWLVFTVILLL